LRTINNFASLQKMFWGRQSPVLHPSFRLTRNNSLAKVT
jgi:hypothetical protein